MEIISHRGYWQAEHEKNTRIAFARSFKLGFGTETDIRDFSGKLVISHDIADKDCLDFNDFLAIYTDYHCQATLALNIKSDGLQTALVDALSHHDINNYFLFDMSVPDTLVSIQHRLTTFARYSEYEPENPLWDSTQGIWLDNFRTSPLNIPLIEKTINSGKRIAIVSAELHRQDCVPMWHDIARLPESVLGSDRLILCTDLPEKAKEFFHE